MPNWALPPLPAQFAAAGHRVFVGRASERAQLERVWEQVAGGVRQTVFIAGAAGSGKSHLVAEVARALHAQDVAVLLGACSPDLGVPYHPLVEALDQLLTGTQSGGLASLIPKTAGALRRITPHLDRHRVGFVESPASEREHRRELFEAYAAVFESVADERPVALVLEDLHWASAPTMLLLNHLIRSMSQVRLLIVGTMRDTAPDRSQELMSLIADAYRSPNVHRIDLGGLDTADIAAYLMAHGGIDRGHAVQAATLLQDQTGGNPFFLRELWRDLERQGGFRALKSGHFTAPRTVRDTLDTLEERLRSFVPAERECLELAAVVGDGFEVGDVAAASGYSRGQVMQALDRASEYGLISYDAASGTFAFQHALVRQALREALSPSRSAALHARLAEVIAPREASQPSLSALLARLYDGAKALGYDDERLRHLSNAAVQAQRSLAHEEAAALWERAARITPADRARTDQLLLAAADSHLLAGDFAEARRVYREVAASPDERAALRAAIGYENASWRPGLQGRVALELLTAALDRVDPDPADPVYVRALASRGRAHAFCGERREAGRTSSQALELARRLADDDLIAEALVASLLQAMTTPGSIALHHQRAMELRRIALRNRDRDFDKLGPVGAYRALASYMGGDLDGWYAGLGDMRLAAAKTGQPFWEWVVGCYEHCQQFMAGDFSAAEATAERIRQLGYTFGSDDTEGPYGIQMFMLRRETGRLEQVRSLIPRDPAESDAWHPGLLAMYTELGMDDSAHRLLWMLLDGLDEADQATAVWPAVVTFLAQAAIHLADDDALRAVEPLVAAYDGFNLVVGQCVTVLGSANLLLAQIRALRGDADGAAAHFDTALAADNRVGSVVHRAETLARYAAFLRGRDRSGDRHHAARLRREARMLAEPRGHQRVLNLIAKSRKSPELPDDLTLRELDVLRLLAEGASNKQIGERLYISQNTAANHVRSILTKTGLSNRTQAAIYAAERGLVTTRTPRRAWRRASPDRKPR